MYKKVTFFILFFPIFCCAKTGVIALHLYHISLMPEFITKINQCIAKNSEHDFYIKISIPIGDNINQFNAFNEESSEALCTYMQKYAPYHPELVTEKNAKKLFYIMHYLTQHINIDDARIQCIFSENRGLDIGGFLLIMDQLIQQEMYYDFLIKVHSKVVQLYRNKLTAILDINLTKFFEIADCAYACQSYFDFDDPPGPSFAGAHAKNVYHVKNICSFFSVPEKNFSFCGGTMFIVPKTFVDFFSAKDRFALFNMLNPGYISNDGQIEHGYERFFGYLMEYLGFKIYSLK